MQGRQASDEMAASTRRRAAFWWGWGVALCLTLLLVVLASLPPYVGPALRGVLMQGFSTVCHQLPARSPHVDGVALAVCHRCYGIYWGLLLAVFGFLLLGRWSTFLGRYAPPILAASLVPPGLDWLVGILGVWHNTPLSRLATGAVFGLVAGYYLARALTDAFAQPSQASEPVSTSAAHPEPQ